MKTLAKIVYENLLGAITLFALVLNCIVMFLPFFVFGIIKLMPIQITRRWSTQVLEFLTSCWISFNTVFAKLTRRIHWQVKGELNLSRQNNYIVVSNHQTWLDIVVLHKLLHRKIPNLKFFVKDQLKWVPLLGFAWWILDCPFMKRYSKAYLAKHPEKKGKDLEATRKACQRFSKMPVSIMNFLEGSRFNLKKKLVQSSPYQHLLKPKAGGIGYVIQAMGEKINTIIDVTIMYPEQKTTLWDYLCGRVKEVRVYVRQFPIPERFKRLDYANNQQDKQQFQQWLNQLWAEKDKLIALDRAEI